MTPGLSVQARQPTPRPGAAAGHASARDARIRGPQQELTLLTGEHGGSPQVSVIEGMPGVGKTALAVHAARTVAPQYPDGTLYLNLHTHDPGSPSLDSAEALHRLLRMLTVPAAQIPDALGERAALVARPAQPSPRRRGSR